MTICIAAIADNSDILAIADKKLTINLGVPSVYEISENKKIVELRPKCIALFAGNITNANEILAIAKKSINDTDTVAQAAQKIKAAYASRMRIAIDDEVLSKFSLNLDDFNKQQQTLDSTFVSSVIQTIDQADLGVEIIVAGKDDKGPEIYKVVNPGRIQNDTPTGYSCVGSGSGHANLSLIESQCHPSMDMESLAYSLVKAKRKAELDPNVGEMTTVAVIKDKVLMLNDENVKKLRTEYDNSVKNINTIMKTSSKVMRDYLC